MADVAMLLVAFFALTAVFTQTAGLPMQLESSEEPFPEQAEAHAIELRLDERGRAWLAGSPLPAGDLEAPLLEGLTPLLRRSPVRPLYVSTHPEAPLGAFVELQDALARASRRLVAEPELRLQRLRIVVPTLAQEARLRDGGR